MEIKGKVHCFFEQSGTFKREFIKLGIPAEDYDIQNNFGETDHTDDLFKAIEDAYDGKPSLWDNITQDDFIMAFFPCIYFCDNNVLYFSGTHINYKHWGMNKEQIIAKVLERSQARQYFYELLLKMFAICERNHLRLIFENPYSQTHYLHNNFPYLPALIDKNRRQRGDFFKKRGLRRTGIESENVTEGQPASERRLHKSALDERVRRALAPFVGRKRGFVRRKE